MFGIDCELPRFFVADNLLELDKQTSLTHQVYLRNSNINTRDLITSSLFVCQKLEREFLLV